MYFNYFIVPNSYSALAPVNFMPRVQRFLSKRLVAKMVANTKFSAQVDRSGKQIDWPTIVDMRPQTYTPGTDLTIDDNTGTSDTISINRSRAATFTTDPVSEKQAEDKTVNALMADRAGFVLAQEVDQFIIQQGVDNANSTVAGGTITAAGAFSMLTDVVASLQRKNATDRKLFAILDPETIALLAQSEVANGFNLADAALKNGFVGKSQAGLFIFNSNNCPSSVTLTMGTQPTATDTITIAGVTWTWVADGTTAAAGEINIGANVADAKAILVDAINNGSALTADWTDVAVSNRRVYQNAQISAATFSGDDCVITGYGKIAASETFTAAGNVFGTETAEMLAGAMGSIALAVQLMPRMDSAKLPNRPMEKNHAVWHHYGGGVFTRDKERLVKITKNFS